MWTRLAVWTSVIAHTLAIETEAVHQRSSVAGHRHPNDLVRRVQSQTTGYMPPMTLGGNMYFTFEGQPTTKPEPINIIVSGTSSFGSFNGSSNYAIFNSTNGFSQYLSALNFSDECLGLHLSTPAYANVSGKTPQLLDFLYRENFGNYPSGTCLETLNGGHHFRGWRQPQSGAYFLAASEEKNLTYHHDLIPDGYNQGKYEFIARARRGGKDYYGCTWPPATITNITDLVSADAGGDTGMYNHNIGIDGIVAFVVVGKPVCGTNSTSPGLSGVSGSPSSTSQSGGSSTASGAGGIGTSKVGTAGISPAGSGSTQVAGVQLAATTVALALLIGAIVL